MPIILWLATEAAGESGFGLNFDILETNIINLGILLGLLVVYGGKFLGNVLNERRTKIEDEIKEAESRVKAATVALEDAQLKLKEAASEAERIRANAEETAARTSAGIKTRGDDEIERMRANAIQELDTEKARVINQLREQVVSLALTQAESRLKEQLDRSTQERIVDESLARLGG
ncbi:MAG: F0F1 ATP synthase subunit B [Cyanobacteria bacterium P01_H01_bin.15]